ncbi:hypothetical protein Tco_0142180, partial [Tanacetum coccineum]
EIEFKEAEAEAEAENQEPPYALPETLLAPVTHNDPRDPYIAARDAATAPATDDSPTPKETSPSEPQGSPLSHPQTGPGQNTCPRA